VRLTAWPIPHGAAADGAARAAGSGQRKPGDFLFRKARKPFTGSVRHLKRFQEKWSPVFRQETRQITIPERFRDAVKRQTALPLRNERRGNGTNLCNRAVG